MTTIFTWIFFVSLIITCYSYVGYGILSITLVMIKSSIRRLIPQNKNNREPVLPDVTVVVAAYNEEAFIQQKIDNTLSLNYPKDKLKFLFVTDGSTDKTPEIIEKYPEITLLHSVKRSGKTAALNRAMQTVSTPITVFCDANTVLCQNAILHIVHYYRNKSIGGVSGEKRVTASIGDDHKTANEGLYWKYESLLKRLDAALYTVVGAAGELFSIRTALWEPLDQNIILDDFIISLNINLKGFRIAYAPDAYAIERPSNSIAEERKRKIRIAAGAFQAMQMLTPVFNFVKHPILFFQFFSHRFLRWTVVPLCLPLLFTSNIVLLFFVEEPLFFTIFIILQLLFYLSALLGSHPNNSKYLKPARICYYLLFMNYAVYLGFFRFIKGSQSAIWEKAERKVSSPPYINDSSSTPQVTKSGNHDKSKRINNRQTI